MSLRAPAPRLHVLHNSNSAQRAELIVPAGAELDVPLDVAEQLLASSTNFRIDAAALAEARAWRDALDADLLAGAGAPAVLDDPPTPPRKRAAPKKAAPKKAAPKKAAPKKAAAAKKAR